MTEAEAMERAIELAWNGWGRVHPNPLVGSVLLRDGAVVSEGWHAEWGEEHAEVRALAEAGAACRGATLVVTLEPCRHQGQQPPCTEAILHAGLARVVFGASDPTREAQGGAAVLRAAGVDVAGPGDDHRVRAQNAAFFHQAAGPDRPFVALKLATSVDGAVADAAGRSRWISGPEARDWVHWLRAGFDAIAVGGRTARLDDPELTVRGPVTPRVTPRRVIFAQAGDLAPDSRLLRTARETPVTVVTGPAAPRDRLDRLAAAGADAVAAPDLGSGLAALRRAGVRTILIEGGARLAGALLESDLVDRFYWIQSPLWLGQGSLPAFRLTTASGLADANRWRPVERHGLGHDTLLVLDRPQVGV